MSTSENNDILYAIADELDGHAATHGKKFLIAVRDPADARAWVTDILDGYALADAESVEAEVTLLRETLAKVENLVTDEGEGFGSFDVSEDEITADALGAWYASLQGVVEPLTKGADGTLKKLDVLVTELDALAAKHGPLFWDSVRPDQVAWWLESIVSDIKKQAAREARSS